METREEPNQQQPPAGSDRGGVGATQRQETPHSTDRAAYEGQAHAQDQVQRQGSAAPAAEPRPDQTDRPVQEDRPAQGSDQQDQMRSAVPQQTPSSDQPGSDPQGAGMLPYHEADGYKRRWEAIQATFVDDPRGCCEQADALVIEILDRMTQIRQEHRSRLHSALEQGGDDTEGLRQAMQHYRSFFGGLLRA